MKSEDTELASGSALLGRTALVLVAFAAVVLGLIVAGLLLFAMSFSTDRDSAVAQPAGAANPPQAQPADRAGSAVTVGSDDTAAESSAGEASTVQERAPRDSELETSASPTHAPGPGSDNVTQASSNGDPAKSNADGKLESSTQPARSREPLRLNGHSGSILSVAFSPGGETLLSGDDEGTVILWDLQSGEEIRRIETSAKSVTDLAFLDGGASAITVGSPVVQIWNIANGEPLPAWPGLEVAIDGASISSNRAFLLTRKDTGSVHSFTLWDIENQTEVHQFEHQQPKLFADVDVSADGSHALLTDGSPALQIWDVAKGERIHQFDNFALDGVGAPVVCAAFQPGGDRVAAGYIAGAVRLWNGVTSQEELYFYGHGNTVGTLAFSPDGERLLTGSGHFVERNGELVPGEDTTVRLWNVTNGAEIARFTDHTNVVRAVTFSDDGRLGASGGDDELVYIWELPEADEHSAAIATLYLNCLHKGDVFRVNGGLTGPGLMPEHSLSLAAIRKRSPSGGYMFDILFEEARDHTKWGGVVPGSMDGMPVRELRTILQLRPPAEIKPVDPELTVRMSIGGTLATAHTVQLPDDMYEHSIATVLISWPVEDLLLQRDQELEVGFAASHRLELLGYGFSRLVFRSQRSRNQAFVEVLDAELSVAQKTDDEAPSDNGSEDTGGSSKPDRSPQNDESDQARLRTWTARNGFTVEAEFLSAGAGQVKLRRSDGEVIDVPLDQLNDEDLQYIDKIRKGGR